MGSQGVDSASNLLKEPSIIAVVEPVIKIKHDW